jgi:hypothetical protein
LATSKGRNALRLFEEREEELRGWSLRENPEGGTEQSPSANGDSGPAAKPEEPSMFRDKNGNRTVGFCLWCNQDFYSMGEFEAHNANNMRECPVHEELKGEHCMPLSCKQCLRQQRSRMIRRKIERQRPT